MTRIKLLTGLLVTLTLGSYSATVAALSPDSVESATIGDATYFRIELPLPASPQFLLDERRDRCFGRHGCSTVAVLFRHQTL